MKRTGFRGLALAVVVAGLVAGCSATPPGGGPVGAGTDPPGPSSPSSPVAGSPTSTATPEPTPAPDPRPTAATSEHPARNIPEPEMPAAAKKHTAAGLKAFTKYWFELVDYGVATGDSETLHKKSHPDCGVCNHMMKAGKTGNAHGRWILGGETNIIAFHTNFEPNLRGHYNAFLTLQQDATVYFAADGSVRTQDDYIAESNTIQFIAKFRQNEWHVINVGIPR